MYSVVSKTYTALLIFFSVNAIFLPTLFAFCTIYAQLWAEKGHAQCDVLRKIALSSLTALPKFGIVVA